MADNKAQIVISAVNRSQAAFREVDGQFAKLSANAAAVAARFGSIGTLITGAFAGVSLKGAIDTLDQLDDLSEKSGIAVEQLSALRFAGESVGTTFEDLATGTRKLAKGIADAAGGSKEAQAAFDAIGVSIKNADGSLRQTDQVLLAIAERFSGYRDGVGKAALAQELFGKSGENLIPLLNQGRIGIEQLSREAEQLGVVYSGDVAKGAADFNDQLRKIAFASEAVKTRLAAELLPALNATASAFLENAKNSNTFVAALKTIGGGIAARLGFDEQGRIEAGAAITSASIARVVTQIEEFQDALAKDPGNRAYEQRIQALRAEFRALQSDAQKSTARLVELANGASASVAKAASGTGADSGKPDAPVVKNAGAADRARAEAERLLKARLDARLKALQSGLDAETDAYAFQQRALQAVFQQGVTSLDAYYAARKQSADGALRTEQAVIDQQVAALRQFQSAQKPGAGRVETEKQIQELLAKRSKLEQDASRAGVLADFERREAAVGLRSQLADVEEQILQLGGNETGAALQRLERQLASVGVAARQLGVSEEVVDRLRAASTAAIQLADIQRQAGEVSTRADLAEQAFLLQAEQAGKSREETERGLIVLRERSLAQLEELAKKAAELAAAPDATEGAKVAAESLRVQVLRARTELDPALGRLKERADEVGSAFGNALGQLAKGDAKGALESLAEQLSNLLLQLLVIEPAARAVSDAIKSIGTSGGGSGGGIGSLLSAAASYFTGASGGGNGNAGQNYGGQVVNNPSAYVAGKTTQTSAKSGDGSVPAGLMMGNVYVTVENRSGGTVSEERSQIGGDQFVKIIVDRAVSEVDRRIASGGSTSRAVETAYGMQRRTAKRA